MKTPDITKVQVVAVVQAVIALALALGLNIDPGLQASIIGAATALSGFLVASDAVIRNGRARVFASADAMAQAEQVKKPI